MSTSNSKGPDREVRAFRVRQLARRSRSGAAARQLRLGLPGSVSGVSSPRVPGLAALWCALVLVGCGSPVASDAGPPASPTGSAIDRPVPDLLPGAPPVADSLDSAAQATTTAVRASRRGVDDDCDLVLAGVIGAAHPEAGQLVVVRTAAWAATTGAVDVVHREADGSWSCERGDQPAVVGRNGMRPLAQRRSGDGTTPAGFFPLGSATAWDGQTFQFFGNGDDPGVRGAYRRVRPQDCWGATPYDPAYGHLVDRRGCPGPDDEDLSRIGDVYVHAALIGANTEPDVSGDAPGETPYAAAIFLHRHNYVDAVADAGPVKPTSGCVSLAIDDLIATLVLLDPVGRPYFAIGPADSWT